MATNEETNAAMVTRYPSPMLVEDEYDSVENSNTKVHFGGDLKSGKLIWKSIQNGPTPHPMVTDPPPTGSTIVPAPRKKLDSEFNDEENRSGRQNSTTTGMKICLDGVRRFVCQGNESHSMTTFVRFHKLVNDMKITQLEIPTHQMNTKFVNNLPAYWGKYVTNVKQNMDISTTPYVQIYTHLKAYEPHAKKTLKKQEQSTSIVDPLAYVAHTTSAPALSSPSTPSPQPTAQSPNDALMATMTQIANLLSGFQKQFPPTNNQLRTSSNTRNYATVHDGQIVTEPVQRKADAFHQRGVLQLWYQSSGFRPMVNTRTDAELAAAVQAAVDAMLPQIREQVREEYRNGASGSGGNPPPVTIHTWLERFNKQKPRTFEKAVTPVDAENWISHMEKIFDVMGCDDVFKARLAVYKFEGDALAWWKAYKQAKGGDAWILTLSWANFKELFFLQFFPRAEQERLKREYHSLRQRAGESSNEFMQRFIRIAGFLGQAAGTAEEQAKNFRWGLHKSILDRILCMEFTDVAQVADAARNFEILRDRDDYDRPERSDKRHKSGDQHQSSNQQNSHRGHDQRNDRHGSDRQGGSGNYRNNNSNNHSRDNNRNSGAGRDHRNRGQQSHRATNSGSQQNKAPSEGYTYPVCTTCGRRHPGECRRAAGTCFKCGQAGHLQRDCKKNTGASSSGYADKKPDASGRVFALTQDQAANATAHHATIDCHSRRVIFGNIHTPEFIYHGSLPGQSMKIISALEARTLLSHGCEGFLANIHDTTSDVSSIHDQPIVSEFQDVFPEELPGIPPIRDA
ncbi:zinc finger, CCHC-type, retrotransposon gag domain protein [Tanacetum coccineum]